MLETCLSLTSPERGSADNCCVSVKKVDEDFFFFKTTFKLKKLFNISKYIVFGDGKRCILLYAHMDQGHM